MPDPYKDEETENRRNSLCLYDVPGITKLNRCANCPGATRSAYHHRRCPLDRSEPNIFHQAGASDPKGIGGFRWSASSNKLHLEAGTELAEDVAALAALSLGGSHPRKFGRSKSDSLIHDPNTEIVDVGGKRKAKVEEDGKAKSKMKLLGRELKELTVQEWLQSRPEKMFQDLGTGNLVMLGCCHISSYDMDALMKKSSAMDIIQEDHPSGKATSLGFYSPGYIINTESEGYGVLPCNDGLFDVNKPQGEAGLMFMEVEVPVPLDQ